MSHEDEWNGFMTGVSAGLCILIGFSVGSCSASTNVEQRANAMYQSRVIDGRTYNSLMNPAIEKPVGLSSPVPDRKQGACQ